jgi:hypothetical protein
MEEVIAKAASAKERIAPKRTECVAFFIIVLSGVVAALQSNEPASGKASFGKMLADPIGSYRSYRTYKTYRS